MNANEYQDGGRPSQGDIVTHYGTDEHVVLSVSEPPATDLLFLVCIKGEDHDPTERPCYKRGDTQHSCTDNYTLLVKVEK